MTERLVKKRKFNNDSKSPSQKNKNKRKTDNDSKSPSQKNKKKPKSSTDLKLLSPQKCRFYKSDLQLIMEAVDYAAKCHKDQRRKDFAKTPYINHPVEVAEFLTSRHVTDRDTIIAALLHDVIEDTEGTYDEIEMLFGGIVAEIVVECSDDKDLNKIKRKQLQIEHAEHLSNEAKLVKLADKFSNVKGLLENPPAAWSKMEITGYVYWALAVCRKLYGVNDFVDKAVQDLFKKHTIDVGISQEKLDERLKIYYKHIDKSE